MLFSDFINQSNYNGNGLTQKMLEVKNRLIRNYTELKKNTMYIHILWRLKLNYFNRKTLNVKNQFKWNHTTVSIKYYAILYDVWQKILSIHKNVLILTFYVMWYWRISTYLILKIFSLDKIWNISFCIGYCFKYTELRSLKLSDIHKI